MKGKYLNMSIYSFRQKSLIELSETIGYKLLFQGKFEQVLSAAMAALRLSIEVNGTSSIQLVPIFTILAEFSIGK